MTTVKEKSGYLERHKSTRFAKRERRYFVLKRYYLRYYKSEASARRNGKIGFEWDLRSSDLTVEEDAEVNCMKISIGAKDAIRVYASDKQNFEDLSLIHI